MIFFIVEEPPVSMLYTIRGDSIVRIKEGNLQRRLDVEV